MAIDALVTMLPFRLASFAALRLVRVVIDSELAPIELEVDGNPTATQTSSFMHLVKER